MSSVVKAISKRIRKLDEQIKNYDADVYGCAKESLIFTRDKMSLQLEKVKKKSNFNIGYLRERLEFIERQIINYDPVKYTCNLDDLLAARTRLFEQFERMIPPRNTDEYKATVSLQNDKQLHSFICAMTNLKIKYSVINF